MFEEKILKYLAKHSKIPVFHTELFRETAANLIHKPCVSQGHSPALSLMAQQSQLLYFLTSYIYIVHDPAVFLITRVFIQKRGCVLSASQAVKGKYVTFMCRTDWRRKLTCDLSAPDTRGGQWKTSVDPGVDGPLGESERKSAVFVPDPHVQVSQHKVTGVKEWNACRC